MMEAISSMKNPKIKAVLALDKSRERKKSGLIKVEGLREIELAQQANLVIEQIFYCAEHWPSDELEQYLKIIDAETVQVTAHVMEKICYRGSVQNALVVARCPTPRALDAVYGGKILVVEGIEKPGNLGAILRTADAAGMDGIFLADAPIELYNPNVIRASLGAVFTVPVFETTSLASLTHLKKNHFQMFTTFIEDAKPYNQVEYDANSAVVVGSEAYGVSDVWRDEVCTNVLIPMSGQVNSMNISVAAAILMYEMVR
jgi:TrmH family RNA methyltransferase